MLQEIRNFDTLSETAEYSVIIEPHAGYSDVEISNSLKSSGARGIKILSPGFISALATGAALRKLSGKADVSVKKESQLHL